MKNLVIYGASDDLIETEGLVLPHNGKEYTVYKTHSIFKLFNDEWQLNIHAIYDGSWAFAICPQDGDCDAMPPWKIERTFGNHTRYSESVIFTELPDDIQFERM